jgi:hypothetical protein
VIDTGYVAVGRIKSNCDREFLSRRRLSADREL